MTALDIGREARQAITLIKSFSLELKSYSADSQVLHWLNQYKAAWIRDAVIEAIYLGRYKIISVQHILSIWKKRGQPVRHFTPGFEQVIASHLGAPIHLPTDLVHQARKTPYSKNSHAIEDAVTSLHMLYQATPTDKDHKQEPFFNNSHHHDAASLAATTLAIEPFPVNDVNTLVEVYQANTSVSQPVPQPKTGLEPSSGLKSSGLKSVSFELPKPPKAPQAHPQQSKVQASLIGSMPIQPFRPNLNR